MTIKKKEKGTKEKEVLNHIKADSAVSNENDVVNRPYSNMSKISRTIVRVLVNRIL